MVSASNLFKRQIFVHRIREKALEATAVDKLPSKMGLGPTSSQDHNNGEGLDFQIIFKLDENVYRMGYLIEKYVKSTAEFFGLLREAEPSTPLLF